MALTPEEELELLELEEQEYQDSLAKKPEVSKAQSAIRGATQGATLGFADELGGLVQRGLDYFGGVTDVNKKLAEQGFTGDIGPTSGKELYKEARDENRALDRAAQAANPMTYGASNVAGSLLTSFLPGSQLAKGTSALKAAGVGAGYGALQGAGNTEEIASMQALEDIASGAAIGGATGGAFQALANKFGKVRPGDVSNKIKGFAELQAAKAQGLERATRKKLGEEASKAVGRQGLDEGVLSMFASADEMIARNNAIKDAAVKSREAAYNVIDEAGASAFNPLDVASDIESKLGNFNRKSPLNAAKLGQLQNTLEAITLRGSDNIPMSEAQKLIQEIGQAAKFDQSRATPANEMAKNVYKMVRNAMDDAAQKGSETVNVPGLKEVIQKANRQYSIAKDADTLLANKFARDANKSIGLTDTITAVGSPVLLPAKKLWESYGNQTVALGFDKLGDMVKNNPQAFGKFQSVLQNAAQRGPQALGASHFILQQNSPEYREQLKQLQEGEEQ